MKTGYRGTFVISCNQTESDGHKPAEQDTLVKGATWRWTGDAIRVDGPGDLVSLGQAEGMADLRKRAARTVRRLLGRALERDPDSDTTHQEYDPDSESLLPERGFSVTDGRYVWQLMLIDSPTGSAPLLVSADGLPPKDRELWILDISGGRVNVSYDNALARNTICFTPGTLIRTPDGDRPIEMLRQGDRIITRDKGTQELCWVGNRRMSGARLYLMPQIRPVRFRAGNGWLASPDRPLLVSPDHRMLIRGARARAMFGENEVLVAARDLVDDQCVTMDYTLREVTYIHLLLDTHSVIWANGLECETWHPAVAGLEAVDADQRADLLEYFPDLANDPWAYGDFARRNLTASEAAILRHDGMRHPGMVQVA